MNKILTKQPSGLKVKLFPHQLKNIENMEKLEINPLVTTRIYTKKTKIGILCDKVGSGKSFCVLGVIINNKFRWDLDVPYIEDHIDCRSGGLIETITTERYRKVDTNLIIVDSCNLYQWLDYLQVTNLTYKIIAKKKDADDIEINNYNVILSTTKLYNYIMSINSKIVWKRFIYDEPGNTRILKMKNIRAGFYWFVTSSPYKILEQYRCCKSGFIKDKFIKEIFDKREYFDMIEDICVKNDDEFINKYFINETICHTNITYQCFQPIYAVINGMVSPEINTMIESGNIENAVLELGGNKTSNLIDLVKKNLITKLEKIYIELEKSSANDKIIKMKTRIEKKISEIDTRYKDFMNQSCSICLHKIKKPILETNCHNMFCGECLLTWLKSHKTCPLCIQNVHTDNLVYIENEHTDKEIEVDKKLTKDQTISDIIKTNPESKFIIYSAYEDSFKTTVKILEKDGIKYTDIKGNTNIINKNIKKYKELDTNIMFLTKKYNATGLNLEETTDIILYHTVKKDTFKNIIGRVNRFGNNKKIVIHHLKV